MSEQAPVAVPRRKVFKYILTVQRGSTVAMPADAKVVAVGEQHGKICMWAIVPDPQAPVVVRVFSVYGTGDPINPGADYLGTFFMLGGSLVWHVFEEAA